MKKALVLALLFTACSSTPSNSYSNEELGIQFNYSALEFRGQLVVEGNKILYHYPDSPDVQYLAVFEKPEDQSIEEAILALVAEEGKNPDNCTVVNKGAYWGNENYTQYALDLVDPNIDYTQEELATITQAETDAAQDDGPFNGEWMKMKIYRDILIEACSHYADPLGLGTSKSTPSIFVYNKKSEFVFLPGSTNPQFYDERTLTLTE